MRVILLTFIFLFSFYSFSQTLDTTYKRKLSIGFTISPDLCYRIMLSDNSDLVKQRNETDNSKIGFTSGLRLMYNINGRWAIESGILFSKKGFNSVFDMISMNGEEFVRKYFFDYYYIDLPIKMNCFLTLQRLNFYITFGTTINFFIDSNTKIIIESSDGSTREESPMGDPDYNILTISPVIGFGFDYYFSRRINMRIEPSYSQSIIPVLNGNIDTFLLSFCINAGIFYNFKRK